MKKTYLAILLLSFVACQTKETNSRMINLNKLLDNYYEERLQYFPMEATAIADNRYNDTLPADISDSYREKIKGFYKKYI